MFDGSSALLSMLRGRVGTEIVVKMRWSRHRQRWISELI